MKKAYSKVYGVYEHKLYGDGKMYGVIIHTTASLPLAKEMAEKSYLKTGRNTWVEDSNGKFYEGYFVD